MLLPLAILLPFFSLVPPPFYSMLLLSVRGRLFRPPLPSVQAPHPQTTG